MDISKSDYDPQKMDCEKLPCGCWVVLILIAAIMVWALNEIFAWGLF